MHRTFVLTLASCLVFASVVVATEPEVYPAKGQTGQQQERDQYECHEWATKETGVDPVALAEQKLATPAPAKQEGLGGAERGAGLGAAGGAMEGDPAAGAARGFGIGRMVSVVKAKRQLREQQSVESSQAADLQGQLDRYDRAYAACLTGRGYSVK
jgi:hypothetical protein